MSIRHPQTVAIIRSMARCYDLTFDNFDTLRFLCAGCLDRTLTEDQ